MDGMSQRGQRRTGCLTERSGLPAQEQARLSQHMCSAELLAIAEQAELWDARDWLPSCKLLLQAGAGCSKSAWDPSPGGVLRMGGSEDPCNERRERQAEGPAGTTLRNKDAV